MERITRAAIPDVAWDSPTEGAELTDLHAAFHDAKLEMITDARERRRVVVRIDAPGPRRLASLAADVRFLVVVDGVRSVRASDWAEGDVPRPSADDAESRRAWIVERQRHGRMQSREWRDVAHGGGELSIVNCMVIEGAGGAALRIDGMALSTWREIVIAGESIFFARSDRAAFDRDALIRLGEAYRDMLAEPR